MSFSRLLALALCLAIAAPLSAAEPGGVYVVPLEGKVSHSQFLFLRRSLKEAERAGASALVLEMETYGGEVRAAILEMDALLQTKLPTYTYINTKALSAGALIALATQKIYMAPTSVIGAAGVVNSDGTDLSHIMAEKMVSSVSAIARAAAVKAGHNPDLADAFIRDDAPLKLGDEVIHRGESLLTLTAPEATRRVQGKPVLAEAIAATLPEMLQQAGLTGAVRHMQPTGFEYLAQILTGFAPLLLLGGIVGAYLEFKLPGFGLPGILSTICFVLFFTGSYLAGLAGWEVMLAFAIGVALILSEFFLHPGTILPGFVGLLLMIGALIWAMIDRYPGQPFWPTGAMLIVPLRNLLGAALLAAIVIYLLGRVLPRTPFYSRLVLAATTPPGAIVSTEGTHFAVASGMAGHAHTTLRPSGKAEIEGRLVDVVSRGEYIASGAALRVVAVEGPRVVVAPA